VKQNMIDNSLHKIKAAVQTASSISKEKKAELLRLLSGLESEIVELRESEPEHAQKIIGFIERSVDEAMRRNKDMEQLRLSLEGISGSVKKFEVSHPRLVEEVNSICTMLANMGI
jgi:Domain of unknown function (DUF4404)